MDTNTPTTTEVLRWQAPRSPNHERSASWYATGGGIVIAGAVYGLLTGVWSLAIVSVLCGAVYFLVRDHRFPDIECSMDDKGVQIADTFMPWTAIKGFWFIPTPTYTEMHFVPKSKRQSDLIIQTGTVPLLTIRSFLAGKTEELVDKQESFIDILLRLTKL